MLTLSYLDQPRNRGNHHKRSGSLANSESKPTIRVEPRYLLWAGAISLALHIALILLMASQQPTSKRVKKVFTVTLAPPKTGAKQIVSPSKALETKKQLTTGYRSDKNRVTEKEQVKRGDGEGAGIPVAKSKSTSAPSKQEPQIEKQKASSPTKPKPQTKLALRLDSSKSTELFGEKPKVKEKPKQKRTLPPKPFSRPLGSGALFLGTPGSADFLPNLPDGDLTLLNEKADRFAVFVRRVATQVFAKIRSTGWETLQAKDILAIQGNATVEAVLSPKGDLISVRLVESSGSRRFDRSLEMAVTKGARDPHPPEGALASDGNIHFVFKSRTWVRGSIGSRGPRSERRWLLLATGLR